MLQRWKWLLVTVEILIVAYTKDPERIQIALGQLRKDFLGSDSVCHLHSKSNMRCECKTTSETDPTTPTKYIDAPRALASILQNE